MGGHAAGNREVFAVRVSASYGLRCAEIGAKVNTNVWPSYLGKAGMLASVVKTTRELR